MLSGQIHLHEITLAYLCQFGTRDHETVATLVGIWPCTGRGAEQETYLGEDDLLAQFEAWQPVCLYRCWHFCCARNLNEREHTGEGVLLGSSMRFHRC